MPDQPPPPVQIRFRFVPDDADLLRLALGVLNAYAAQQFAGRHGLPLDECPAAPVREFVLSVPARRLEEVLLGLRNDHIVVSAVDCPDPAALDICQALGVLARLLDLTAGPVP
jgi:hypothetical protein